MLPRRHILILHQAALGDFVLTWPVAMALARVFAQSRVAYVTGTDKGRLAEAVLGVEAVDVESGWHALHADMPLPDGPAKTLLGKAQCMVVFSQSPEPRLMARLADATGGAPLIGLSPNPPPGVHVWQHQLDQLPADQPLRGYVGQMQQVVRTRGLGGPPPKTGPVLLHPGSGAPAKNWPAGRFVDLAERLKVEGRAVEFVLGDVERDRMPADTQAALAAVAPVRRPADLVELHRLLKTARAYVGNDSGPTHLAAVLGVPTVALFGPASAPEQWGPVGRAVTVLPFETAAGAVVEALA